MVSAGEKGGMLLCFSELKKFRLMLFLHMKSDNRHPLERFDGKRAPIFYARLRKIQEHKVQDAVTKALDEVNLLEWGDVLSSRFSGGNEEAIVDCLFSRRQSESCLHGRT